MRSLAWAVVASLVSGLTGFSEESQEGAAGPGGDWKVIGNK